MPGTGETGSVDLFWLPLGAGGHVVRWNGQLYEALVARHEHRRAASLFHSALQVTAGGRRYVIEMAPVWNLKVADRGVVQEGPVGSVMLGRLRAFRYEVRSWPDGCIPDLAEAVGGPVRVAAGTGIAERVLELVPQVPPLTWGRDELGLGEMWNSNSLTAWLLTRCGLAAAAGGPPGGGRAPGWRAGLELAARQRSPSRCPDRNTVGYC